MLFDGVRAETASEGRSRQVSRGALVAAAIVGGALASAACEPTAIVTPNVHAFQAIHSTGAVGGQCEATSADTRPGLRFTLVDTNSDAIFPFDSLGRFMLELGDTFRTEDVSIFQNQATVFPSPDVDCDGVAVGSACPEAGLAAAGFTCQPIDPTAPPGDAQARVVCALRDFTVEVSANSELSFRGDDVASRSVIMLFANGSSVLGLDADGVPSRQLCSSDPLARRTRGAALMLRELAGGANPFARDTELCLGTFTGQSEPAYRFPDGDVASACFQNVGVRSSFDFLDEQISRISTAGQQGGRNPWGALRDAISRFDTWAESGSERHIVLFTDGDVDALSAPLADSLGHNYDATVADALAANVTVHVAQLDRADIGTECAIETVHGFSDGFSRLACATGGNYAYLERADYLPQFLANVGRAIPGNYEAELVAEGLALLPLGPYKLAFTLTATVDGRQESYVFSALAGAGDSASGRQDTRVAMINRGDCTSRACQTGYVCDPDGPTCEPAVFEGPVEGSGEGSGEGA